MKNRTRQFLQYIIVFWLIFALSGCTQNNGYIGELFGTWHLQSVTPDGEDVVLDGTVEFYLQFQGEVVCIKKVILEDLTANVTYGVFNKDDDMITLNFLEGYVSICTQIGLEENPITLQIKFSDGGDTMTLIDTEEKIWVFKKHG